MEIYILKRTIKKFSNKSIILRDSATFGINSQKSNTAIKLFIKNKIIGNDSFFWKRKSTTGFISANDFANAVLKAVLKNENGILILLPVTLYQ